MPIFYRNPIETSHIEKEAVKPEDYILIFSQPLSLFPFSYYSCAAFANECVDAVRHARTFPVPRYTLTSPSPFTADPSRDFEDRSTVNFRVEDQQTAYGPSILTVSLSRTISTSSDAGTLLSSATTPLPLRDRLKSPSPPATADDRLDLNSGRM